MGVFDLFSKRQKRLRGEVPDVYVYDTLVEPLRVQFVHITESALGSAINARHHHRVGFTYDMIVNTLRNEYGVFVLAGTKDYERSDSWHELMNFLLAEKNVDRVLDGVELIGRCIDKFSREFDYIGRMNANQAADEAIEELNTRFREHGVGYRWEEGEIIRVDSEFVHVEAVKPALALLHAEEFRGAQEEFLAAFAYYRHGDHKACLVECLKSLESVLKVICHRQSWCVSTNATAKQLLDVCFANDLIPAFWAGHFGGLRSVLESGVPTARNKRGGHGQGNDIVEVPAHLVAYVLHMTASTIVFLVEAERDLP